MKNKEFNWISIYDRLPESDVRVLVCVYHKVYKNTTVEIDYMHRSKWVNLSHDMFGIHTEITHWTPLPKTPKIFTYN